MPRAIRDPAPVMALVLARVRAGETVAQACGGDGLASPHTVKGWTRRYGGFREELSAAVRQGAWRRVFAYDEAKAAAFLARVRAGARVVDVVGAPGMPSRRTFEHWRLLEPAFAEAMAAIRARRDHTLAARGRAQRRAYDPALGDRIYCEVWKGAPLSAVLAADPELPCTQTLRRWRREQPAFDAMLRRVMAAWRGKRRAGRRLTPGLRRRLLDHILCGGSFNSFCKLGATPAPGTLTRWVATRPDFAAEVARACVDREDWYMEQILEIGETAAAAGLSRREIQRRTAPLSRQLTRLKNRPGRRRARGGDARTA
ncbi:hypothetical protein [Phenylobacterium sp.]|uniref:terminase small subunit-like protein n=1 Tax=Phenylobacterium sp. TaxID=1871053 RepID=UPI0025DF1469|nr:hypothetical protein [Phenylobacterium sp.]